MTIERAKSQGETTCSVARSTAMTRRSLLTSTGKIALLAVLPSACTPVVSASWSDGTFWDDGQGWIG